MLTKKVAAIGVVAIIIIAGTVWGISSLLKSRYLSASSGDSMGTMGLTSKSDKSNKLSKEEKAEIEESCPNQETFGEHKGTIVNNKLKVKLEVTYFNTSDVNAFISERDGLSRSPSFVRAPTTEFTARLEKLEDQGLASIRKQGESTSAMGEMAEVSLERNPSDSFAAHAASVSGREYMRTLDRQTRVSVAETKMPGEAHYLVSLISYLVDVEKGQKSVDLDSTFFLCTGQTAIFKLASNKEIARSGTGRNYVAITMHSIDKVQ